MISKIIDVPRSTRLREKVERRMAGVCEVVAPQLHRAAQS